MSFNTEVEITKIKDLNPGDRITRGTLLGTVIAAEDILVKKIQEADNGRFALTLTRTGTLFISGDAIVEVIPYDQSKYPVPVPVGAAQ